MKEQFGNLIPNAHTTEELRAYLAETYHAAPLPESSTEYGFFYRAMKSSLAMREAPELLQTPEPKLPNGLEEPFSAYTEAFERRIKEAEELPDDVLPMSYSVWRFPVLEGGEKRGEMTVEMEDIRQRIGISYANFKGREEPIEISQDIIRYFGVGREDIETQSERLVTYLHILGKI